MSILSAALAEIAQSFPDPKPDRIGIAVSGGSDSLALLHLMVDWGQVELIAATVDHGLRVEAEEEAETVKRACQALGVEHKTLVWNAKPCSGNLQDQARQARYGLLADWARAQGCGHVVLGHTMDDVAETYLMRLARRAGVDGLSAMRAQFEAGGVMFHRPLLARRRSELRDYLCGKSVQWIDDPSNDDPRFERVKARKALGTLGTLGIDAEVLSTVAANMSDARDALEQMTREATDRLVTAVQGDLRLARDGFEALHPELQRRVFVTCLKRISSAFYSPRQMAVQTALEQLRRSEKITLGGCIGLDHRGAIYLAREYDAVRSQICASDQLWDNRWRIEGPHSKGLTLAALGEQGLGQHPDWRETGRPRVAVLADPGIWHGDSLVAAPTLNSATEWRAVILQDRKRDL